MVISEKNVKTRISRFKALSRIFDEEILKKIIPINLFGVVCYPSTGKIILHLGDKLVTKFSITVS